MGSNEHGFLLSEGLELVLQLMDLSMRVLQLFRKIVPVRGQLGLLLLEGLEFGVGQGERLDQAVQLALELLRLQSALLLQATVIIRLVLLQFPLGFFDTEGLLLLVQQVGRVLETRIMEVKG